MPNFSGLMSLERIIRGMSALPADRPPHF
jgi:hypothetical protein